MKQLYYNVCMKTSSLTIRINDDVKTEATELADELGLSISSVVTGFLKTFIRTRKVTFSAQTEEPTEYLLRSLEESRKDVENGDVVSFDNADDALSYLDGLILHDKDD